MELGKKITQIRKKANLTQEEMAEILLVSRQTVSNWENLKCYPDIETLIMISNKFNISLDSLLKNDEKMIKDLNQKIKSNKKLKVIIIILTSVIILLLGKYIYDKVQYYLNMNTDNGSYIYHDCNLNGERLHLMVKYYAFNSKTKKWNEFLEYDPTLVKPVEYIVKNKKTNEIKKDIMSSMNYNVDEYSISTSLLSDMISYIINIGGTCDK